MNASVAAGISLYAVSRARREGAESAKQILTRIVDERKNDKVAIVVFAGESYVQLPMTTDIQAGYFL